MGKRSIIVFGSALLLFLFATQTTSHLIDEQLVSHEYEVSTLHMIHTPFGDGIATETPLITHAPRATKTAQALSVWATAYTSHPDETDDTPFITASGSYVRDGVAAANFLPIGTTFRLPELFGSKEFVVEDRMNARYNNVHIVDIWFDDKSQAIEFGKQETIIEIL